jgi:hypothetical protein
MFYGDQIPLSKPPGAKPATDRKPRGQRVKAKGFTKKLETVE